MFNVIVSTNYIVGIGIIVITFWFVLVAPTLIKKKQRSQSF